MIKIFIQFWILICLSGYFSYVQAQAYDFRSLTVNEGLPHGQITDIHQTKDGYIWIGTAASGVAKFDGILYTIFDASMGLKNDMVTTLYEDSNENLWVATYGGGVALLEENKFTYPFDGHAIDESDVLSILEAPDGKIWFSSYKQGIFIYDGENLDQISVEDGLISNSIWHIHWDEKDDTIWLATHHGISIIDGNSIINYDTEDGISGQKVYKIIDHDGTKWMATNHGITLFDGTEFSTITEINGRQLHYVYDLIKASNGRIWIGMENDGVYWYENENFFHITRTEGLVSNNIYRFYEDRNNNVWIATDERGISIFRGESFRFFNSGNGLNSDEVLSLFMDENDTIWIGGVNGLQSYNGSEFNEYRIPDKFSVKKYIWDIEILPNGDLILLLDNSEIIGFDGEEYYDYSKKIGIKGWFYDLKTDSRDNLWMGSDEGLIRYNGDEIRTFGTDDGLPGWAVYHVFESREGDIWIATNNGVARFDGETFFPIGIEEGLAHYNVNYITQDQYGELWFGTSAGVTHYKPGFDGEKAEVRNFGKQDGMKLVETLFLLFDENDQLWQGTNGGIHHLDIASYRKDGQMNMEHYKLSNYGIGVETMHKASLRHTDGTGWFGTMNGILTIDPQIPRAKNTAPVVVLEEMLLNGNNINWNEYKDSKTGKKANPLLPNIEIPYGNNTITFNYSALEFLYPEKIVFRYKLEGFDENWSIPTENSTATYTNLSPGKYSFNVQSKNGSGDWGAESAGYSFSIALPFWQTYWFWGLMIFGAGFAITGFIKVRVNYLERDKLNRLVEEQTKTLREALCEKEVLIKEIHHRVKNNLAVIYSLLELQSGYIDDEATLSVFRESKLRVQSIALIHEKIYQNESLSKIEARKYLPELAEVIVQSVNDCRNNIKLNHNIEDVSLSIDQGIPCGLILNELITNAYKHAFNDRNHGEVDINFYQKNDKMVLIVKDNGKGLPENFNIEKTESLGLILVNTLSTQLQADLIIKSNGVGSSFELTFEKDKNI